MLELEEQRDRLRAAEHEREMERKRMELEMMRFEAINLQARDSMQNRGQRSIGSDLASRTKLMPKFDEKDLDSFFFTFERIAMRLEWPKDEWALLVQQVLTGKAQAVFSSLSCEHAFDYEKMKDAILQSYEQVPEAYRQQFRNMRRFEGETHVELARRKEVAFDRWIRSLKVDLTYEALREIMLLEECKRGMAVDVRTHVNDSKESTVKSAAMVADSYELTHKVKRSPPVRRKFSQGEKFGEAHSASGSAQQSSGVRNERKLICYYCKSEGHVKTQCPKLKLKNAGKQEKSEPNGFVCVSSGVHGMSQSVATQTQCMKDDDEIDERYKDFVSCGVVRFSRGDEIPVTILRDTGATQTLLVADQSSLDDSDFSGKQVLIQDVNGGYKPIPLCSVELKSQLVSGLVTDDVPSDAESLSEVDFKSGMIPRVDNSKEPETAFNRLKAVLMSDPVLEAPNFETPFQLAVDASDVGVGAVLLQKNESGLLKPVSYFSKKLNRHQRRYSTIEKECLGLVLTVQHFEVYLSNSPEVTVYTDHNPLTFLERFRSKNQRLFRWSLFLQPYGLKVTHIKGKDNIIADALSRA
ncbi:uncharacterized protein [Diadema setosum]|uniref:uncharacterized protein n=1 Tax=Diadema setosum TaxID=31175 RepID=UPI003B3B0E03